MPIHRLHVLLAVLASALSMSVAPLARASGTQAPLMNGLFQDHAVLQRDRPVPVWGRATAGQTVTVSIDGKQARARADAVGHWQATLPALRVGGPYTLTAKTTDGTQQVVHDVLVGDVWLCSGQSNMELPVKRTLNWPNEVANAHDGAIRMLIVAEHASVTPRAHFAEPAAWQKASPETVADFSATCYYFARALKQHINVPMGLIDASWGGAQIQAWMNAKTLHAVGGHDDALAVLDEYARDPVAANARWGTMWEAWWRKHLPAQAGGEPWQPRLAATTDWHKAPSGLGAWGGWNVPALTGFTGMVWFRTTVALSAAQAARSATLALGLVDETDQTWVNGRAVGSEYLHARRDYRLPTGLLHAGTNSIVVNVLNTYGDGGILGPASTRALHFDDGSQVPLAGPWMYRMVSGPVGQPPLAPWLSAPGLTTLYNGMIAPLGDYAVRGEVWYQGASNVVDAGSYATLLRAYRKQMRVQFGHDMPLLIVQLSDFGPAFTKPGESGWAELREAQRQVAADDAHSALAVTIDIGSGYALHPPNKQELGLRLARAARHVAYGEKALSPSGPVPLSVRRESDAVVIRFGQVGKGLAVHGADEPIGFELCGAGAGSCRYARATIHDHAVTVRAANAASATRVRYGWADSPVVNLFDGNGLPVVPFQLPVPSPR